MSNRQHHPRINHRIEHTQGHTILVRKSIEKIVRRVPCVGGCGRFILDGQGECRYCRRSRIHAGKKRLARLARETK